MDRLQPGDILLLDIEGTITSITFVKDILFPYVRNNLKHTLDNNWEDKEFQNDVEAIRVLTNNEMAKGDSDLTVIPDNHDKFSIIDTVCRNVIHWMDRDQKLTALKDLQGHVWRKGYECGHLRADMYPDVITVLKQLSNDGTKIYIYSSGSVEAQKLLFSHTAEGDITEIISGYFDTHVGLKTEAKSYSTICQTIGVEPKNVLFLTDVEREAYPCKEAGCRCVLIVREGNEPLSEKANKDFQINSDLKFLI